jgi:hypothetical protein
VPTARETGLRETKPAIKRPTWIAWAHAAGVKVEPAALRELLTMVERVLHQGFGLKDPNKGLYHWVPVSCQLMAQQAARRKDLKGGRSVRSYRRALADAEDLGLLIVKRIGGRPPLVRPAWYGPEPDAVWRRAASVMAERWPCDGRVMAAPMAVPMAAPSGAQDAMTQADPADSAGTGTRDGQGGTVLRLNGSRKNSTAKTQTQPTPAASTSTASAIADEEPEEDPEAPKLNIIVDPDLRERCERHLARRPSWKPILLAALVQGREAGVPQGKVVKLFCEIVNMDDSTIGGIRNGQALLRLRFRKELKLLPLTLPEDGRGAERGKRARFAPREAEGDGDSASQGTLAHGPSRPAAVAGPIARSEPETEGVGASAPGGEHGPETGKLEDAELEAAAQEIEAHEAREREAFVPLDPCVADVVTSVASTMRMPTPPPTPAPPIERLRLRPPEDPEKAAREAAWATEDSHVLIRLSYSLAVDREDRLDELTRIRRDASPAELRVLVSSWQEGGDP